MTTSSPAGPPHSAPDDPLIQLPPLDSYTEDEWRSAEAWPAVARYRSLLAQSPDDPVAQLRIKRHRYWLQCTLATFFDRISAKDICRAWSDFADELIDDAWKLSGASASGLALIALGKLGSRELNLSSDVDLIAVRPDDMDPPLPVLREFQRILSEINEFGFALRVDFTLRPGGRSSPAIPSLSQFEYHYGYHGEMWERLAFVRMRLLQGPDALNAEIRDFCRKFSYRRHLDYTLIDELKNLRGKIRREKFETRPGTFHLKLGEGGIRELELFVHALQVVHGGRNPEAQTQSTTLAATVLAKLGVVTPADSAHLIHLYWRLRTIENRLHGYEDQQNYLIHLTSPEPPLDEASIAELAEVRRDVVRIATSFFSDPVADIDFPDSPDTQEAWLLEAGFSRESATETWPALLQATALSRSSDRDEQARILFLKGFALELSRSKSDRDLALSLLLDFVRGTRAKASFFTLLNRETRIRDELVQLFSVSPYLGSILAGRPELIDEFIFRKLAPPPEEMNAFLESLTERRLLVELISATQFLRDRNLENLCVNVTENADAIASLMLDRLNTEYGPSQLRILALGKWGGRELGLRSDLDFVFVTTGAPTPEDARVAKRFMSRMTEPHRGGNIYSIDMRLRPSGSAGPIMVSEKELTRYLTEDAAAWERQAYLRARLIGDGSRSFNAPEFASAKGLRPVDREELRAIRIKLFSFKDAGELDLKLSPGGLADIEFTAQIALLAQGRWSIDPSTPGMVQYLESIDSKWRLRGHELREAYFYLRRVEQLYQLTTRASGSKLRTRSEEFRRLAAILERSPADLEAELRAKFDAVTESLRDLRE